MSVNPPIRIENIMTAEPEFEFSVDKTIEANFHAEQREYKDGFYHISDLCVASNTWIRVKGGYKEAKEIVVGDEVLTHKGVFRKIKAVYKRKTSSLIKLKPMHFESISLTPNHPVYMRRYYWDRTKMGKLRVVKEPEWRSAGEVYKRSQSGCLVYKPLVRGGIYGQAPSDAFCELLGYYQAEGNFDQNYKYRLNLPYLHKETLTGIAFSLNLKEKDFGERINELAHVLVGRAAFFIKGDHAQRRYINSVWLASELARYCDGKHKADEKKFTEEVMSWHPDKLKIVLFAFIRGDGCNLAPWRTAASWGAYTASRTLALQLQEMALICGFNASISRYKQKGFSKGYLWAVTITEPSKYHKSIIHESSGCWVPVRKIAKIEGEMEVVNFSVEEDESYTSSSITVHNCGWGLREDEWCPRQVYWRYRGQTQYNREMAGIYERGRLYEAKLGFGILNSLQGGWVIIETQKEIIHEVPDSLHEGCTVKFVAHPDYIAVHPPDNQEYVLEIKSVNFHNRSGFLEKVKLGSNYEYPKAPHILQANFYSYLLKKPFYLVYVNTGDMSVRGFKAQPLFPSEQLFNVIIKRGLKLHSYLYNNELPEGVTNWSCLDGDTEIMTVGGVQLIRDLAMGVKLPVFDNLSGVLDGNVLKVKEIGKRSTLRIGAEGREIICTPEHKFLALINMGQSYEEIHPEVGGLNILKKNVWEIKEVKARDLSLQTALIIADKPTVAATGLFRLWGCFVGDGHVNKASPPYYTSLHMELTLSRQEHIERYTKLMEKYWGPTKIHNYGAYSRIYVYNTKLARELRQFFYDGETKIIPREVYQASKSEIIEFLRGLVDAEGYWNTFNNKFYIEMADKRIVDEARQLALYCGLKVSPSVFERTRADYGTHRKSYMIGLKFDFDNGEYQKIGGKRFTIRPDIPLGHRILPVTYIEKGDFRKVYDISVSPSPLFYVEGVVTHNCNFEMRMNPRSFCPFFNPCHERGDYAPAIRKYSQCKKCAPNQRFPRLIKEEELRVDPLGELCCPNCGEKVGRYYG